MLTVCKTVVMLPKGIYTVGEAERLGVSRMQLAELVKRGGIERLSRGARVPTVDFPIEVVYANASAYGKGIEVHEFNGVHVQVYSAARTVADLFKFRGRVGLDLAIESLKTGLSKKIFSVDELMRYARLNRVANVIRPYVEGYFG